MKDLNEEMRSWSDTIQFSDIEDDMKDADEQSEINRADQEEKRAKDQINEMPLQADVYKGDRKFVDNDLENPQFDHKSKNMIQVNEFPEYNVYKNPTGNAYMAISKDGEHVLATVQGKLLNAGKVFKVELAKAHSSTKGIMTALYDSILKDGKNVLSDTIQSDGARRLWEKLISDPNRFVYVVMDNEIVQRASPEKAHKYWSTDSKHISSSIQFLLVK